jgi:hypothetical protein
MRTLLLVCRRVMREILAPPSVLGEAFDLPLLQPQNANRIRSPAFRIECDSTHAKTQTP